MRRISMYGKGGVGKSIIAANLAACLSARGVSPALVGCSPKGDTTYLLLGKLLRPTILDQVLGGKSTREAVEACLQVDPRGVLCLKTGGPEPAAGCAGRGVSLALQLLSRYRLLEQRQVELAIFDVIAGVVCGGFAEPMKKGYTAEIYIITSGEIMSLYAANNICIAALEMQRTATPADVRIGGLIFNRRGFAGEDDLVESFSAAIQVPIITRLPRTNLVQQCEAEHRLVVDREPNAEISRALFELSEKIQVASGYIPQPFPGGEAIRSISALTISPKNARPPHRTATPPAHLIPARPVQPAPPHNPALRRVAIYGKAGIGKSTISSNISAALSEVGRKVIQIGCDPKSDSVFQLTHRMVPTVLQTLHAVRASRPPLESVVFEGYNGIACVESGGPAAGIGCAGQGVFMALEYLEEEQVFARYAIDFAVFDILGDVVCGGFAQPLRGGYCNEICVVTNGEPLSLYAANNILRAINHMDSEGIPVGVLGIIDNQRGVPHETEIVEAFAAATSLPVLAHVPRSPVVQQAELTNRSVIEAFPHSDQASIYRLLAHRLASPPKTYRPTPLASIEQIAALLIA